MMVVMVVAAVAAVVVMLICGQPSLLGQRYFWPSAFGPPLGDGILRVERANNNTKKMVIHDDNDDDDMVVVATTTHHRFGLRRKSATATQMCL